MAEITTALALLGAVIVIIVARRCVRDLGPGERLMGSILIVVALLTVLGDSTVAVRIGLSQIIVLLVVLAAFVAVTFRLRESGVVLAYRPGLLIPAAIVFVAWGANLRNVALVGDSELLVRLSPAIYWIFLALWIANLHFPIYFYSRILVLGFGVALTLGPLASSSWRECDIFKCSSFDALYTGIFVSENQLGILAGAALLAAGGARLGWLGMWLTVSTIFVTFFAATARSSLLAAVFAASVFLFGIGLGRIFQHLASVIGILVSLAVLTASCLAVFTNDPQQFSHRGAIWIAARRALEGEWLPGIGVSRWTYLQWTGRAPQLFPHNEFLILAVAGGVLCSAVYLLWIVSLVVRSSGLWCGRWDRTTNATFAATTAIVTFLATLGTSEAFWNPLALTGSYFLIGALMLCEQAISEQRARGTAGVKSDARAKPCHIMGGAGYRAAGARALLSGLRVKPFRADGSSSMTSHHHRRPTFPGSACARPGRSRARRRT